MSLAAWWSAWKWVAILAALVVMLAAGNLWQWQRAITAPLREENKALADALNRVEEMAKARDRDDAALLADLTDIAERARTVRTEYRTVIKDRPLPANCAPGQERVDTVNRALRGLGEPK